MSNSSKFKKLFFLLPLILFTNSAYADNGQIQMDWLLEGQTDDQNTTKESQIISNYENNIDIENNKSEQIIYDKFVTNNKYSIGDYKIAIDSEEGQILNRLLIEQQELQSDSFKHKIQYYDRFSDGYIQIVEALLEPIGEQKYLINGQSFDYNPNSNLEYFVLERGYDLENLEVIPNHIFSPAALDKARQTIADAKESDEAFDLRVYSPNYMRLDENTIQEKMRDAISEQTAQIFNEIITGKKLQRDGTLSEIEVMVSQPQRDAFGIFDNFKFKQSQFENTQHVRDILQDNSLKQFSLLILIPIIVGLAVFGYVMRKKLFNKKPIEPLLQIVEPKIDFREQTKEMLQNSLNLYNNNQRKEAHEILSQAIRYYYSKKLGITKEVTNFELLLNLKKSKSSEYDEIRDWIILCGSVEYAKYKSKNNDFLEALSKFSDLIS